MYSHLLACAGQARELAVAESLHEQLANTAQVRGRRLRQPGDAGIGQSDDDAAPVYVSVGSRDQTFVDKAIDATGHTRTRTVRLCRKLTDAQFSARTAKLCQDIEIAQGETNVFDEIGSELAHRGGVRADEGLRGLESVLRGDRLGRAPPNAQGPSAHDFRRRTELRVCCPDLVCVAHRPASQSGPTSTSGT